MSYELTRLEMPLFPPWGSPCVGVIRPSCSENISNESAIPPIELGGGNHYSEAAADSGVARCEAQAGWILASTGMTPFPLALCRPLAWRRDRAVSPKEKKCWVRCMMMATAGVVRVEGP